MAQGSRFVDPNFRSGGLFDPRLPGQAFPEPQTNVPYVQGIDGLSGGCGCAGLSGPAEDILNKKVMTTAHYKCNMGCKGDSKCLTKCRKEHSLVSAASPLAIGGQVSNFLQQKKLSKADLAAARALFKQRQGPASDEAKILNAADKLKNQIASSGVQSVIKQASAAAISAAKVGDLEKVKQLVPPAAAMAAVRLAQQEKAAEAIGVKSPEVAASSVEEVADVAATEAAVDTVVNQYRQEIAKAPSGSNAWLIGLAVAGIAGFAYYRMRK